MFGSNKLRWSMQFPKEPGWYWIYLSRNYRDRPDDCVITELIQFDQLVMLIRDVDSSDSFIDPDLVLDYAGPIDEPTT